MRSLMVLGTASHVGKSVLTAAFCRILAQDGYRVAPFKAQNMALNSAATPEGHEIGRAQAMQAEAAGIPPSVDMNPILLKPTGEARSQLIVRGRAVGDVSAREYHGRRARELFRVAVESYRRLAAKHDVVVLEGAGSAAEVNLVRSDIVNLRMAKAANAACLLVADIDRGGVFGSLVGTFALLSPADRRRFRGFIVNRFRGDASLFRSGVTFLERRLRRPCLGVVPYLEGLGIDEEDSVALETHRGGAASWPDDRGRHRRLRVGVLAFPRISNFTDFDALAAEPSVALAFIARPGDLARADVLILPGTKQTLDDLAWLRRTGLAAAVGKHADRGGPVIGVCGGMQMLGREVSDPHGLEGGGRRAGLALLGLHTVLDREKVTTSARASLQGTSLFGHRMTRRSLRGYEIHLGTTRREAATRPLFRLRRPDSSEDTEDGARNPRGNVVGTYLHGLFDTDDFRHALLTALRAAAGLAAPTAVAAFTAERERRFDRLAAHVRRAVDIPKIESWLR